MRTNATANTPITVGGEPVKEVESFVYLGSVIDKQGGTDQDVKLNGFCASTFPTCIDSARAAGATTT